MGVMITSVRPKARPEKKKKNFDSFRDIEWEMAVLR